MPERAPETGDRLAPADALPILVDTSAERSATEPQGDRHAPGEVFLVHDERRAAPTADEYRAAGYTVPDHDRGPVAGGQIPGLVYVDQRAPEGSVFLVDTPVDLPPKVAELVAEPAAKGPENTQESDTSTARRRPGK